MAGAVSIGCVANLEMNAGGALIIGIVAGLISTYGFNKIQPYLEERYSLHDTCGIHNLHGMPSVLGAVASMFVLGGAQATNQFYALFVNLAFCIPMGLGVGYILREVLYPSFVIPSV